MFSKLSADDPAAAVLGGICDAFVTKMNASGSALIYSTYLGGNGSDAGSAIAITSSGSAFVTGFTPSSNFPLVNPLQRVYGGGGDAFVSRLDTTGSALLFSTYMGGSKDDQGQSIAVDVSANAYVAGITNSANFHTKNPFQAHLSGPNDGFITKIAPASMVASPNALAFGKQQVNSTSAPQNVTLTNEGATTVSIANISISGNNAADFAQTNKCGSSLSSGTSCSISVTFTPTGKGSRSANLSISELGGKSQLVSLTGTGT